MHLNTVLNKFGPELQSCIYTVWRFAPNRLKAELQTGAASRCARARSLKKAKPIDAEVRACITA